MADIGCGIRPIPFLEAETVIYVEPWHEYADWLEAHGFNPVRKTALEFLRDTSPLDCILMFDVIEHMEKDEGAECLSLAKEKAKQVLVFTPYGYQENHNNGQEIDPWNMHGVEHQRHKSGWTEVDFPGWQTFTDDTSSLLAVWG